MQGSSPKVRAMRKKQYLYTNPRTNNLSTKNPTGSVAEDICTLHIVNNLQIHLNTKDTRTQCLYCSLPSSPLKVTRKLDRISAPRLLQAIHHRDFLSDCKDFLRNKPISPTSLIQIKNLLISTGDWAFTSIRGGES